jgi:hypothetical protein
VCGKRPRTADADDMGTPWPGSAGQWQRLRADSAPQARCSHTCTLVGDTLYLVAGGYMNDDEEAKGFTHLADVWVLPRRTMVWEHVVTEGAPLPPRRGHSMALHSQTSRLILFGGLGGDATVDKWFNDTWVLHTQQQRWEEPECSGTVPRPRRGHRAAMTQRETTMLVVGGYATDQSGEDFERVRESVMSVIAGGVAVSDHGLIGLFALGIDTWAWSEINVTGAVPKGLALFGCAVVGKSLFCFGGHEFWFSDASCGNTLWRADLSELCDGTPRAVAAAEPSTAGVPRSATMDPHAPTVRWQVVPFATPDGGSDLSMALEPPPPRFCLEMVQAPTEARPGERDVTNPGIQLVVFGGTGEPPHQGAKGPTLDDLHLLSIRSDADIVQYGSRRVTASNGPSPAIRNGMTLTRCGEHFVLFGGGVFGEVYYSDTWRISLGKPPPQSLPPWSADHAPPGAILAHLASLVGNQRFSDVDIEHGSDEDRVCIPAHRMVLCSGASSYFSAVLEGSFREAAEAAAGGRVRLRLPDDTLDRPTLMRVLHWLYTGVIDLSDAGGHEHAAAAGDAGGAEGAEGAERAEGTRRGAEEASSSRAVALLVAADALGIESLRGSCEGYLARTSDVYDALELLSLSTQLHCPRLRAFCLTSLGEKLGASSRSDHASAVVAEVERHCESSAAQGGRPWCEGGELEARVVAESRRAVDATIGVHQLVHEFAGFEGLSEGDRRAVEWQLGLPNMALAGTREQLLQSSRAASIAAISSARDAAMRLAMRPTSVVTIEDLQARADLNGATATLILFDRECGRWVCRVATKLPDGLGPDGEAARAESPVLRGMAAAFKEALSHGVRLETALSEFYGSETTASESVRIKLANLRPVEMDRVIRERERMVDESQPGESPCFTLLGPLS